MNIVLRSRPGTRPRRAPLVVLLLVGALATGCASGAKHPATSEGEEQALTYQYKPFEHLDPQRVSDGAYVAGQNLLEGMVTPDSAGTGVLPATADTWTVSKDGTVYTFHIRSDAKWSNGTPVTARDFEWAYKRLLTPSTRALDTLEGSSSYQTNLGIKNATSFQVGRVTDWSQVGVKTLDPSHLRITLDNANSNFLQGMADTSMVPLPEKNLEKFPFAWQKPARWVGNGPFVPKSWTPNSRMVLVPNDHYWDRKNVHLNRVNITLAPATDAQKRRRYRNNELDITTLEDPATYENDPTLSPALTRLDEYSVLFLTIIPSRNPALEDLRVREAIALAIDRGAVAKAGEHPKPATSLVPTALPGFDATVGFRQNVAKARKLMAEAGYPGGKGFPVFSILTYRNDPHVAAVVNSLQQNLGIKAVQDVEDPGVYSAKRHEVQPASYVGYFSTGFTSILTWRNWVSNLYSPAQTELLSLEPDDYTRYEVLQAQGTAKSLAAAAKLLDRHASPQSREFAAVAARADATANPDKATALYKQAAAIRQRTYEFIPFGYRALVYAIRPNIKGVHHWTGYFTISFKGVSVGKES
jgi:oligopeptide transport system substrate-binding protein